MWFDSGFNRQTLKHGNTMSARYHTLSRREDRMLSNTEPSDVCFCKPDLLLYFLFLVLL